MPIMNFAVGDYNESRSYIIEQKLFMCISLDEGITLQEIIGMAVGAVLE